MRHGKNNYHFNRDANSRKALFLNLSKSLIEKEQIKTTLQRAKALRGIVERLITRAKTDTVANRRLTASDLHNDEAAVKKLFSVLGPRYKDRPGGYTRVLKAGFRYGDAAEIGIIELVGRDVKAKGAAEKSADKAAAKLAGKSPEKKAPAAKLAKNAEPRVRASKGAKEVAVKRRSAGK
jgi:large subunit ribosomal protein L17